MSDENIKNYIRRELRLAVKAIENEEKQLAKDILLEIHQAMDDYEVIERRDVIQ